MTTPRIFEYWIVQNTGWSGGVSWFDLGGSPAQPLRFTEESKALDRAAQARKVLSDRFVRWRLVHVRVETTSERRVTTETFKLLKPVKKQKSPS